MVASESESRQNNGNKYKRLCDSLSLPDHVSKAGGSVQRLPSSMYRRSSLSSIYWKPFFYRLMLKLYTNLSVNRMANLLHFFETFYFFLFNYHGI